MDLATAKVILSNLCERIEVGEDGKLRLPGIITPKERDALLALVGGMMDAPAPPAPAPAGVEAPAVDTSPATVLDIPKDAPPEPTVPAARPSARPTRGNVPLVLTSLAARPVDPSCRVCLDFGTARSKASFVRENRNDIETIQVLRLGIPGDQEEIDELMLVSSVFLAPDDRIWFGQHAVDQARNSEDAGHSRIDNIKRALSEGNLSGQLSATFNPTSFALTYEDIVLAYLAFFTWTVNQALLNDVDGPKVPSNFQRRFAMPCFPRASASEVDAKLKVLLGEAQVLADTFGVGLHAGLPLADFMDAVTQLRSVKRTYPFVDRSVTEPLGVAGSLLSWTESHDSLVAVVDIGAGTSDFSLYRLLVTVEADGEVTRTAAIEVDKTACGITEAGNHLDKILLAHILQKAGVDGNHPKFRNISHALERDIREYKEYLFSPAGAASITLYNGDAVDVSLDEFLALGAIRKFEDSLRATLVKILQEASKEWVDWVKFDPHRRLTIVLTGGGASLPMTKRLVESTVTAHGVTIPVAAAKAFPNWLREHHPDLEDAYPRVAVSLGGARKHIIAPSGVAKGTGIGGGGYQLERFR